MISLKKLKHIVEVKCVICGRKYYKYRSPVHNTSAYNVRMCSCITCSSKGSKERIKRKAKEYWKKK